MDAVCNHDCFNCPHPDCILGRLTAQDYDAQREAEKLLRTPEQRKIAAKQRAHYEANRDEIAAKKRVYMREYRLKKKEVRA